MPAEKDFIGADQLLEDSFKLGLKVLESGFHPQYIVGVWRGGTPIGCAVQELLEHCNYKADHIAIRTSSYYGIGKQDKTVRVHGLSYIIENANADDGLLIVDDVYDSGRSIQAIIVELRKRMRLNTPRDIRVATVYFKPENNKTGVDPDYYIHTTKKWLVFPHEMLGLTPEEIKIGKGALLSEILVEADALALARDTFKGAKNKASEVKTERTVCVTGASGFLGSWVTKYCLERGWTVHATTRSIRKHGNRLKGLVPEATAAKRLRIFECDLLEGKTFSAAMRSCDALMHTASPFFLAGANEDNVVTPAVQGTINVMKVASEQGIKDVVLTSSTAAVYGWYGAHDENHVMTEDDWSIEEKMIEANNWYCVGKTRAEKKAWELAKEYKLNLAVMNPTLIFGPMLQPTLNTSSAAVLKLMNGSTAEVSNCTKCIVDVRDVAEAHCLALEAKVAPWGKRHLLVSTCPKYSEIADSIRKYAPASMKAKVPTNVSKTIAPPALGSPAPHQTKFDVSRAVNDLGLTFRGTDEMLKGTVDSLVKWKLTGEDESSSDSSSSSSSSSSPSVTTAAATTTVTPPAATKPVNQSSQSPAGFGVGTLVTVATLSAAVSAFAVYTLGNDKSRSN